MLGMVCSGILAQINEGQLFLKMSMSNAPFSLPLMVHSGGQMGAYSQVL